MCLHLGSHSRKPAPNKAMKDIVAYKIMIIYPNSPDKLHSYFYPATWKLGETKQHDGEMVIESEFIAQTWATQKQQSYRIENAIHAYTVYPVAVNRFKISTMKGILDSKLVLVKGIIPAGTPYYINPLPSEIACMAFKPVAIVGTRTCWSTEL